MSEPLYQQKPGVHVRQMDDQAFLADPDTDALFHLNPVGTAVWQLLEQPISAAEIIDLLADAFPDAGRDQIAGDITTLLGEMAQSGLVFITDAPWKETSHGR